MTHTDFRAWPFGAGEGAARGDALMGALAAASALRRDAMDGMRNPPRRDP